VLDRAHAPLERPPRRVVARACCRGAYLRGAFLGGGSLSMGHSPHLELRTAAGESARLLEDVARAAGVHVAVVERDSHAAAYAKSWDAIESLLALVGADEAVLALEERAVVGETRARANRLANADHANLVRTSRAAHEQLRAVRRLEAEGRLEELAPRLREAADLRRRYPELPLRELALKCEPPATKAAVHRRLQTLVRLAEA
jgi:DNA-binding protein WhiA